MTRSREHALSFSTVCRAVSLIPFRTLLIPRVFTTGELSLLDAANVESGTSHDASGRARRNSDPVPTERVESPTRAPAGLTCDSPMAQQDPAIDHLEEVELDENPLLPGASQPVRTGTPQAVAPLSLHLVYKLVNVLALICARVQRPALHMAVCTCHVTAWI